MILNICSCDSGVMLLFTSPVQKTSMTYHIGLIDIYNLPVTVFGMVFT